MAVEIKVPTLGESVTEATVASWFKKVGDAVAVDEPLVELETDKVTLEVPSPVAGVLEEIIAEAGAEVEVDALLAKITEGAAGAKSDGAKSDGASEASKEAPIEAPKNDAASVVDITVPTLGESVTEATVASWFKQVGDAIAQDEPLVELETDKVTLEIPSPVAGVLNEIVAAEGAEVHVGALLAKVAGGASGAKSAPATDAAPAASNAEETKHGPAVEKLLAENGLDAAAISGTGKDGRLTKGDVLAHISSAGQSGAKEAPAKTPEKITEKSSAKPATAPVKAVRADGPREERVKMSRLRRRIAERLKEAQNTAAILTTFNDVDMSAVMDLRARYKEAFEKKHGVRLGFMGFFVKACIAALKEIPAVNAEIDGDDLIYKNHYDIGVAVGGAQGLVVPVIRDADLLSLAGVEATIGDLGRKARDGDLSMGDLTGGTFTISNGGAYGSMLSTPILNPPQSGILGMHRIEQRPVVHEGEIVARPMMYLALSYDHRVIDGREAVTFLVRVKENIEDPERLLLDV